MIAGLDFAAVPAADLSRAVAFYRDVLGLKLHTYTEGRWAEFLLPDGNAVCLYPGDAFGEAFVPAASLSLRVDDVEAAAAALDEQAVAFPTGRAPHDSGFCHSVMFLDSEGNRVFLHRRYQPEP